MHKKKNLEKCGEKRNFLDSFEVSAVEGKPWPQAEGKDASVFRDAVC